MVLNRNHLWLRIVGGGDDYWVDGVLDTAPVEIDVYLDKRYHYHAI